MYKSRLITLAILGLILGASGISLSGSARAQTVSITIQNFAFQPPTMTIPVGTTVTWTNMDSASHTSTSDAGDAVTWSSPLLPTGGTFSFTFTQAGTFPYHCSVHPN